MKKLLLLVLLAAAPAAAAAQDAGAQRIGAAGGVSGLVKATAPGAGEARVIKSGAPMFLNDHIVTGGSGKLQVLLLDETVFTIGPNSDLLLDEFVYDPSTDAGKVSAKMTKGVFRFVTGKVARKEPANMKVKLSVGTIGIRGTMVAGRTDESGSTVILLGPGLNNNANEAPGAILVQNGNTSVYIDQPGFGATLVPGQQNIPVSDMSQQAGQLTSDLSSGPEGGSGEDQGSEQGGGEGDSSGAGGSSGDGGSPGEGETAGGEQPGGEGTADSGESVGEEAGQTTAAAGSTLTDASGLGDMTQALTDTSNAVSQDIITETQEEFNELPETPATAISTWDQMLAIPTGVYNYSAVGLCTITGSASGNYNALFDLVVDFGARTYGGGQSGIILQDDSQYTMTSTGIFPTDFSALGGNAVITLTTGQIGANHENPAFDGTQITFNNVGGVTAANATVDLVVSDWFGSGSTQMTAERTAIEGGGQMIVAQKTEN